MSREEMERSRIDLQPRSTRTNSIAGPFLPSGNQHQPPLPRRHSETVSTQRIPPPIPIRRHNAKPIFLPGFVNKNNDDDGDDDDDDNVKVNINESDLFWRNDLIDNGKLIDLDLSKIDDNNFKCLTTRKNADFSTTRSFDDSDFIQEERQSFTTSFEKLQKATCDFDKRIHDNNIDRCVNQQIGQRDDNISRYEHSKFDSNIDQHDSNNVDKRCKFEALQAASKNLEKRLQSDRDIQKIKRNNRKETRLEKLPKATQTNLPPPLSSICQTPVSKPISIRQDSNVSSDSFSQTSSPSYTSKTMEAPLLPHKYIYGKIPSKILAPESEKPPGSPITKSMSTPASLQTIVRFHSGSNMSLHHRIIRDIRRPSSHYISSGKIRLRLVQILFNAVALIAIAGAFLVYFKNNQQLKNDNQIGKTSNVFLQIQHQGSKNPAPGICLPVIVSFCIYHKVPYNFTVFPNYMGNFGQRDAQHELENYEAVVDVRCYELAALFLCNVFVPKCGSRGQVVRPCRSLCNEMTRRCGFFLNVFGIKLPDYLACDYFPENSDPDICVGHREVLEAAKRAEKPVCSSGFLCDITRCIPVDWKCDGHWDCADRSDEIDCGDCLSTEVSKYSPFNTTTIKNEKLMNHLPNLHCGKRKCMLSSYVCDGVIDCPWGQDERSCLKLSEKNGDNGKGLLQVYSTKNGTFVPACVSNWQSTSAQAICNLLGYSVADYSMLSIKNNSVTLNEPYIDTSLRWRLAQKSEGNLLKELQSCTDQNDYPTVELTCSEYACGRRHYYYGNSKVQTRIVGGEKSAPGDWPFLAALLGGPEEVFYCAGVLISDQWVLTASHCVGNHSDLSDWTIQMGITRRHSHTYLSEKMKVKRVVPHPNYNLGVAHDNDVALFQLEERVNFHEHLRPVCLPKANIDLAPGTICTVIGWGKKEDTNASQYEPAVNEVKVPILERELCNSWLEHKELNITDGMICAGYPEGKKDACQGDSGGPLLCQDEKDKEKWFVGGIVSWGIKCAHPRLPGVYAYVPKYVPWIKEEIKKYTEHDKG